MATNDIILTGKTPAQKVKILEDLIDLIEEKYNWVPPGEELTYKVVSTIIDAIIVETSLEIQYEMFQTLYSWSWFPCPDEPYDKLLAHIDQIKESSLLILLLRILAASGNSKYIEFFRRYENNDHIEVARVARESIDLLTNR